MTLNRQAFPPARLTSTAGYLELELVPSQDECYRYLETVSTTCLNMEKPMGKKDICNTWCFLAPSESDSQVLATIDLEAECEALLARTTPVGSDFTEQVRV